MSASRRFLIAASVVCLALTAGVALRLRTSQQVPKRPPILPAGSVQLESPRVPSASHSASPPVPRAVRPGPASMLHLDPGRTNRSPFLGPAEPVIAWSTDVGGPIETAPVQLEDGTIVLGTLGNRVVAVSPDGAVAWSLDVRDRVYGSPLVARDLIFAGTDAKRFVAISSRGTLKWQLDTDGEADTAAAPTPWGALVFAAGKTLYATRLDGSVSWRVKAHRKLYGAPAVGPDGSVYVGSQDDRLYAVTPTGQIRWSAVLGGDVDCAPAVDDDGTVYAGADGGRVVALDPEKGSERWRASVGGHVRGSLTLTRTGRVVVGTYGPAPAVVALDGATGRELWRFGVRGTGATEFGVHGSPVEDAAGNLYFGAQDDMVYSLTADGQLRWRLGTGGDVDAPIVLAGQGRLIAASDDGKLYCAVDRSQAR